MRPRQRPTKAAHLPSLSPHLPDRPSSKKGVGKEQPWPGQRRQEAWAAGPLHALIRIKMRHRK